jgi:hypothetical protein
MRHPLSTSGRRRRLQGLAAVGQGAQGRVVALARRDFPVVELAHPDAAGQAAEGPLVHGGAQVVVVRQAAGDDEFAAAGAAGVSTESVPRRFQP